MPGCETLNPWLPMCRFEAAKRWREAFVTPRCCAFWGIGNIPRILGEKWENEWMFTKWMPQLNCIGPLITIRPAKNRGEKKSS